MIRDRLTGVNVYKRKLAYRSKKSSSCDDSQTQINQTFDELKIFHLKFLKRSFYFQSTKILVNGNEKECLFLDKSDLQNICSLSLFWSRSREKSGPSVCLLASITLMQMREEEKFC